MLRSYVCRQCRTRLSQRAVSSKSPRWQSRATFISLRTEPSRPHSETRNAFDAPGKDNAGDVAPTRNGQQAPLIRKLPIGDSAQRQRPGRYSKHAQDAEDGPSEYIEFQPKDSLRGLESGARQYQEVTPAQAIERGLDYRDARQAWEQFVKHYTSRDCPALTTPSFGDVALLNGGAIFSRLCDVVITQYCNGLPSGANPTELLFRYEQLGIAHAKIWQNVITYMTEQLLWSISGTRKGKRDTESILFELISIWRLLFQCKGLEADSLKSISPEWKISPYPRAQTGLHRETNFGARLAHHHPKYVSNPSLQFSAITLFNLFDEVNQQTFRASATIREQSAPFIQLLTHLLPGARLGAALKHAEGSKSFQALPEDFRKVVVQQVETAPVQAMKLLGQRLKNSSEGVEAAEEELTEDDKAATLEEFFLRRIARAVLSQSHVGHVEKLWQEVVRAYALPDQKIAVPSNIYNAFLSGFMTLHQSEHTVKVWNHMIANDVMPNVRTWVAMLDGCVKARDLEGFDAVWGRMLTSGIEPDDYAWTTRVYGLIKFRQISRAFTALDEMGRDWRSAETAFQEAPTSRKGSNNMPSTAKPVNNLAKPSVQVVNGAVSAIVQLPSNKLRVERKVEFMSKVLQWAGNFGVKPDTRTYNIFIQLYLSVGDYPTTFKLLHQMEQEGLEGDLATHTMLVRAAFDNQKFHDLPESEQADRVIGILDELEAGGLKLNEHVYQVCIDRLLKHYRNYSAVQRIMQHMVDHNLVAGPHIYSSLITHYLQQDPPNITQVDATVAQIFGPPRAPTDKFIFDRIIEGYAVNGEVGKMMSVLARMSSDGKLPGWRALTSIVKALVEAGDWDRARLIVRDIQTGEGVARGGVTGGWRNQQDFFDTVKAMGGGLLETLAGEHLQTPVTEGLASRLGAAGGLEGVPGGLDASSEHVEHQSNKRLEGLVQPKAQELYAQKEFEADADDEFVHAEHASYLTDEPTPHQPT